MLCERRIATIPKCATIGTVQQSISASQRNVIFHASRLFSTGQIHRQTGDSCTTSTGTAISRLRGAIAKIKRINALTVDYKELFDGICNYAGNGTQSLALDTGSLRKKGDSTVVRDLVQIGRAHV